MTTLPPFTHDADRDIRWILDSIVARQHSLGRVLGDVLERTDGTYTVTYIQDGKFDAECHGPTLSAALLAFASGEGHVVGPREWSA